MPPDSTPGQSVYRYLESSRRPSGPERRLLSWLASAVGQEVVDQAADASVIGECTCGCSSLRLSTPAAPLPVETAIQLSDIGRADYLAVSSSGRGPDGHIRVVLHVVDGRLYELEIFAGEGAAVNPASVTGSPGPRSVEGQLRSTTPRRPQHEDPVIGLGEESPRPGGSRSVAAMRFRVEAILFDIDGTLVDSTAAVIRTWTTWAAKHGIEGYLKAAAALGRDIRRCLVVEDAPAGIDAGRAAGARVLAVTTSHPASDLTSADAVISDLTACNLELAPDGVIVSTTV